LALRV
jgi:hypothetical protein